MISNIYNTNEILFPSGYRKGKKKKDIEKSIDKAKKSKNKSTNKKKKVKVKVNHTEEMLKMYEKRREKHKLNFLKLNNKKEMITIEANKDYSGINHKNFLMRTEDYFDALNERDITKLEGLYHPNVELHDWDGSWFDSPVVLQFNETLFDACLTFELVESKQIGNRTYNHILIHPVETDNFFQSPPMKVMDVLYFDDNFKITKIEAFKG